MVKKGANVDGRWWRMGSPGRERGRCGWLVYGLVESMKECGSKGAIMGSREYGFGI